MSIAQMAIEAAAKGEETMSSSDAHAEGIRGEGISLSGQFMLLQIGVSKKAVFVT
jgi:hypothetical protein